MSNVKRSLLFDALYDIVQTSDPMPKIIRNLNIQTQKILKEFDEVMSNEILVPVIFYTKEENFIFLKQTTTKAYTAFLTKFALSIITSPYVSFTYKNLKELLQGEKKLLQKAIYHYEKNKNFIEKFFGAELITHPIIRKKINNNENINIPLFNDSFSLFIASFNHNNQTFFKDFILSLPFVNGIEVEFVKPYKNLKKYDGLVSFNDFENTYIVKDFYEESQSTFHIGDIEKIINNISFKPINEYVLIVKIHFNKEILNNTFKLNSFIEYLKDKKIFLSTQEQLMAFNKQNLINFFI